MEASMAWETQALMVKCSISRYFAFNLIADCETVLFGKAYVIRYMLLCSQVRC